MMDLGRQMASWWFVALLAVGSGLATPPLAAAQAVSPSERDALVRLYVEKGGRAEDIEPLIRRADDAAAKTLPAAPLTNKIREGIAKGYDAKRIDAVIQQIVVQLEAAERLLRELEPAAAGAERDASLTLLAESLGSGVTSDEVRELVRQARAPGGPVGPVSPERLSGAAKGLSFIKEAKLPVADGTSVMAEALRHGFRPPDLLDLGRAIKLRQDDYREGRASLRAVRDAIVRGDRPDQLFRDNRGETATRPAPARPDAPAQRPERPEPPPQRPERPQQPERPQPPERSTRPGGRN
jgi:hypothetical protein